MSLPEMACGVPIPYPESLMHKYIPMFTILAGAVLCSGVQPAAAQSRPAFRVGIFDSRAVALAYGNSAERAQYIQGLLAEREKAKAAHDDSRVKEVEQEGQWSQVRAHQQVFSTAPVTTILAKIQDKLPAIAAQAGVALIVSKWEVPFKDGTVETVDVTLPIVKLFNPSDRVLKWVDQLKDKEPIAFEKLPLDPN